MTDNPLIYCSRCGAVIGVWPVHMHHIPHPNVFPLSRCPGVGRHKDPRRWSRMRCFGLIESFIERYPETRTMISGYRYCGPPSLIVLTLVVLFFVPKRRGEHYRKIRIGGRLLVWTPFHTNFWKDLYHYLHAR